MASLAPLSGKRILVTGVTGMVGGPHGAQALAADNTVFGGRAVQQPDGARRARGVRCHRRCALDLGRGRLRRSARRPRLRAELRGARRPTTGTPTSRPTSTASRTSWSAASGVDAFFQCSTGACTSRRGRPRCTERRAARRQPPRRRVRRRYSISKIAAESLVQHTAKRLDMPDGDRPAQRARTATPSGGRSFQVMMVEHDIPIGVHPDAPSLYAPLQPRRHRRLAPLPARGGVGAGRRRELGRRRERGRRRLVRA